MHTGQKPCDAIGTESAHVALDADRCLTPIGAARCRPDGSGRPFGGARRVDVAGDLGDERLFALEDLLVAETRPELDDQPFAVEIAVEVEEVRLDPSLGAAVVRVRPDRDSCAVRKRLTGVDPIAR